MFICVARWLPQRLLPVADIFVKELINEKVLTKITRNKIVRITPPLVISKKEVITLINKIEKVLERIV